MATHQILGGKVHVYRRPNSRFWQCSSYLAGRNRRTSTKQESLQLAKEFAEDWYLIHRGARVARRNGGISQTYIVGSLNRKSVTCLPEGSARDLRSLRRQQAVLSIQLSYTLPSQHLSTTPAQPKARLGFLLDCPSKHHRNACRSARIVPGLCRRVPGRAKMGQPYSAVR